MDARRRGCTCRHGPDVHRGGLALCVFATTCGCRGFAEIPQPPPPIPTCPRCLLLEERIDVLTQLVRELAAGRPITVPLQRAAMSERPEPDHEPTA